MAEKGKTRYDFFNCNNAAVEAEIQNFLSVYHFKQLPEVGPNVYQDKDAWKGIKGFEYGFDGNHLAIDAYVNDPSKPYRIDVDGLGAAVALNHEYLDMLNKLFASINQINANGTVNLGQSARMEQVPFDGTMNFNSTPENGITMNSQFNQPQGQQQAYNMSDSGFINVYQAEREKKNGNMAIMGFVISLIMLVTSCLGIVWGAVIIVANFYLISQGLKSSKKGLAIAAMIISIVAIVMGVIWLIISVIGKANGLF